jgi:hypothetical protein
MDACFFPDRADAFRPTRSFHPRAVDGPFGVLTLETWDKSSKADPVGHARDHLAIYVTRLADLDAIIAAAEALRADMTARPPVEVLGVPAGRVPARGPATEADERAAVLAPDLGGESCATPRPTG